MESKTVSNSVVPLPGPSAYEPIARALRLLVAKGGSFSTSERWAYDALRPFVNNKSVYLNGETFSIGEDFENTLLGLVELNSMFVEILKEYRAWLVSQREAFNVKDSQVVEGVSHFNSVDQQILYLANRIAELSGEMQAIQEVASHMSFMVNDLEYRLASLESQVHGEDTDS